MSDLSMVKTKKIHNKLSYGIKKQ